MNYLNKILLFFLLLAATTINAENNQLHNVCDDGFEWLEIIEDGKHGVRDSTGKIIIPFEYKWINYNTEHKVFFVCDFEDGKGIYNRNGVCIIPTSRGYYRLNICGTSKSDTYSIICNKEYKPGHVYVCAICNWIGEEVLQLPLKKRKYRSATPNYIDGRCYITIRDAETERWGIIDIHGNVIVRPQYNDAVFPDTWSLGKSYKKFISRIKGEYKVVGDFGALPKIDNPFPYGDMNSLLSVYDKAQPISNITKSLFQTHQTYQLYADVCPVLDEIYEYENAQFIVGDGKIIIKEKNEIDSEYIFDAQPCTITLKTSEGYSQTKAYRITIPDSRINYYGIALQRHDGSIALYYYIFNEHLQEYVIAFYNVLAL